MQALTQRQQQILDWIREFIDQSGMPPTRADLSKAMGFKSPNAAEEHLRTLQRKGAIEMLPGASRGIRLVESLSEALGLPLVGRVADNEVKTRVRKIKKKIPLKKKPFYKTLSK